MYWQDEYVSEGLDWIGIEYTNNTPTIQLLEKKGGGILSLLDEQCAYVDVNPKNFVGFVRSQCGAHPSFVKPARFDSEFSFKVQHYAGLVDYEASKFIDKNRDELNEELQTLMLTSEVLS